MYQVYCAIGLILTAIEFYNSDIHSRLYWVAFCLIGALVLLVFAIPRHIHRNGHSMH